MVVTDASQKAPDGVAVLIPPRWLMNVLGRSGAKLFLMWRAGRQVHPYLYMGYHLFPGALSALVVARLQGRPAANQMTGGPIELLGGGYSNENTLMSSLRRSSRFLERLALLVVREFDLVVVRGQHALEFLKARGISGNVAVITGSIPPTHGAVANRTIDVIFVGRLAPIKQPELFVQIVSRLIGSHPDLRAVVVGSGPELSSLQREAQRLGVQDNLEFLGSQEDVGVFLRRSKVFVLTSRSEGMSIAMLEAMSHGVPPVVADVGELSDVVHSGLNGWLVRGDDPQEYVARIRSLLDDPVRWQRLSNAALEAASELAGVESVARRWRTSLAPFSGTPPGAVV
ncbi:MAG: glycosyltransferase family 4 protein [Gammaproteobacteria bacterium]